ncbi:hypothetical protein ANTHELSMS3_04636 (plasmid) [Antarctobacter heliothermus]|uniref:Uncharacterized protein n=1 Tax=Antarctobacter heliothermus TaxID=74033 RepID=A0A222EC27_9RHOB|nr:hypothetical protein [Antarctobacter heliothermus]ASP23735.1 hypothetical protein ANTHELSMS3_04636 [Antarctobacter heliothermus]
MNRHIVVITFLELLNWNSKGLLRVASQRLVWCHVDGAAAAFQSSLQFAPDLEPADDAFLIANVETPPRDSGNGTLLLPLDGTKFEVLSERSSRLLSPAAKRMNANLELAIESIQDAWVSWKKRYNSESADQQSRRIWAWAWANPWPSDPQSPQEQLLRNSKKCIAEMSRLLAEKPDLREKIAGTSAEAWMHMALAAEQGELLASEDDAEWRRATRAYITSCARTGQLNAAFFQNADTIFSNAFDALPLDRVEMVELVATAIGEHHALRLNTGQEPDLEALVSDLRILSDLAAKDGPDRQKLIISTALLTLGGLLPGTAVGALMVKTDLQAGWGTTLLQGNKEQEIAEDGMQTVSPGNSAVTLPHSIAVSEAIDNESGPSGAKPEAVAVAVDRETEPQPSMVSATVAPLESKAEDDGHAASTKKSRPKPGTKPRNKKKQTSTSSEDAPPPNQGKLSL